MRRVLTVGLTYTGDALEEEIDNLGLCRPEVDRARAAYPLSSRMVWSASGWTRPKSTSGTR
ncbi:hypothetical protein [Bradyrhizobium sp. CCBAU 11361]|uniref:hypothetical protein n=1 Tax=Bradyrhizobium sp. CCBAU 11361 TaxID=1630812 RepID=UPI00230461CC|nr:hypothetical protein [Bradyrhizobium sp. CCBAU 11361]